MASLELRSGRGSNVPFTIEYPGLSKINCYNETQRAYYSRVEKKRLSLDFEDSPDPIGTESQERFSKV
jgi:hypothetical protein